MCMCVHGLINGYVYEWYKKRGFFLFYFMIFVILNNNKDIS